MMPSINNAASVECYQWKVLPQGMKNSPTIRHWYMAQTLSPVRGQFLGMFFYPYMNDILITTPTKKDLSLNQSNLM